MDLFPVFLRIFPDFRRNIQPKLRRFVEREERELRIGRVAVAVRIAPRTRFQTFLFLRLDEPKHVPPDQTRITFGICHAEDHRLECRDVVALQCSGSGIDAPKVIQRTYHFRVIDRHARI